MKFWYPERIMYLLFLIAGLLIVGYFGSEMTEELDSSVPLIAFAAGGMWAGMYAEKLLEAYRIHKWFAERNRDE